MKTILVDAVNTFVIKTETGFNIFQSMKTLLDEFPNQKIILTGANDEQFKTFGLDKMPYEVFTLKHDPEKTDSAYYKTMLKHFNLMPEEVIYFEHNPNAAASAESVGIKTYVWNPATLPLEDLRTFLRDSV